MVPSITSIAAAGLILATAGSCGPVTTSSCSTGVKMIVARGSKEAPGFGTAAAVVDAVKALIPNSSADPVDYPARLDDERIYLGSVMQGTRNARQQIEDYAAKCPSGKIVLVGYSQGAQVVGDAVCGMSSRGFPTSADLGDKYADNGMFFFLQPPCLHGPTGPSSLVLDPRPSPPHFLDLSIHPHCHPSRLPT